MKPFIVFLEKLESGEACSVLVFSEDGAGALAKVMAKHWVGWFVTHARDHDTEDIIRVVAV